MSAATDQEAPQPAGGPGFFDAVTFSFGDPEHELYGLARAGLGDAGASGLAVLFSRAAVVAASSEGAVEVSERAWEAVRAAGVRTTVEAPLEAWTVSYAGEGGGFDLRFEACSAPAVLDPDDPVARVGAIAGYEQLCTVAGTVRAGDREVAVQCLGQRGRQWGAPDWKRIALARTVTAWLGPDRAVTLTAIRPAKAKHHLDEAVAAWVLEGGEPVEVFDARLSTGYDGALHQRRAGLELWLDDEEDSFPLRVAGEVLCGSSIDLGRLRLDTAFFGWRMDGRTGVGRYDLLRRADGAR